MSEADIETSVETIFSKHINSRPFSIYEARSYGTTFMLTRRDYKDSEPTFRISFGDSEQRVEQADLVAIRDGITELLETTVAFE